MKASIIAHPNSKRPRIEKDLLETLHVHISAPPLEEKTNRAIVETLAKYFKIKKVPYSLSPEKNQKIKSLK